MCVVSLVVHTSNISTSLVVKESLFQLFCGCEQFRYGRSFGFLAINVGNHGEHYETLCRYSHSFITGEGPTHLDTIFRTMIGFSCWHETIKYPVYKGHRYTDRCISLLPAASKFSCFLVMLSASRG
jgi:hypothetical protein